MSLLYVEVVSLVLPLCVCVFFLSHGRGRERKREDGGEIAETREGKGWEGKEVQEWKYGGVNRMNERGLRLVVCGEGGKEGARKAKKGIYAVGRSEVGR